MKDRKTVPSALWLQLSLVVFYLPSIAVLSLVHSDIQSRVSSAYYLTANLQQFQIAIKPNFLMLEDRISETSSEDDNQTTLPLPS